MKAKPLLAVVALFVLVAIVTICLVTIPAAKPQVNFIGFQENSKERTARFRIVNESGKPWSIYSFTQANNACFPIYSVAYRHGSAPLEDDPYTCTMGASFFEIPHGGSLEFETETRPTPFKVAVYLEPGTPAEILSPASWVEEWIKEIRWRLNPGRDTRTWSTAAQ